MAKFVPLKKGVNSVLIWSVISAAFIGPGTVATCAKAGFQFGTSLLWAITFSIVATFLLQELVVRMSMSSGKNIGQILALKYQSANTRWISKALFMAVLFGCCAYEAGNILGAVAGLKLVSPLTSSVLIILISGICFFLLYKGSISQLAKIMGLLVFFMGILFFFVAMTVDFNWSSFFSSALLPSLPGSSGTLLIALIGTTIVPYNLFLASGMKVDQSLNSMRWGLLIAILIGGVISMAILISGILVKDSFSFSALYLSIKSKTGSTGAIFFALGLFAAGFSSAITAPLAAAICGQSLLGIKTDKKWSTDGKYYRMTWAIVLLTGTLFSLLKIQAIPVIIAAQGINGLLLPIVCIAFYMSIHDTSILRANYKHSSRWDLIYLFIIGVTCFLGIYNIQHAILNMLNAASISEWRVISISSVLSMILILFIYLDQKKANS
ncbi:MAG: Nramp family divalent metal transporter [Saprospiraceae bacterium]